MSELGDVLSKEVNCNSNVLWTPQPPEAIGFWGQIFRNFLEKKAVLIINTIGSHFARIRSPI